MAETFYQSVRIKPQTMRSSLYFIGDVSYQGVQRTSTIQQLFDTNNPYLLKYMTEQEKQDTNLEDARKTELSYLITNSIKLWLLSKVGDYGRPHPGMGGPLDSFIGKVLSDTKAKELQNVLLQKITTTFQSVLTVNTLTVTPVIERRTYNINLNVTYILVNKAFSINTELAV